MNILFYILLVAFYLYVAGLNLINYLNYIEYMTNKLNSDCEYLTYKEYAKKNTLLRISNFFFKTVTLLVIALLIKTIFLKLTHGG
jgi:hypothetical protein